MLNPKVADQVFLSELSPNNLDLLLENGYFRNSNIMSFYQIFCLDGELDDVINIRLKLGEYQPPKKIKKIANKAADFFNYSIGKAVIDEEKERMYHEHKKKFKGFLYDSLEQMLLGEQNVEIFNTYEVSVYDGDRLIAYSFFDVGENSIASIIGVYNSDYSKFSLGILTMYVEILWAKRNHFTYYYPGYVLLGNNCFDYKLRLGKFQYMNWQSMQWEDNSDEAVRYSLVREIKTKIQKIQTVLDLLGIAYAVKLYPHFTLGYIDTSDLPFYVKSPMHICLLKFSDDSRITLIEYDLEEKTFVLSVVKINLFYKEYMDSHTEALKSVNGNSWKYILEYVSIHPYSEIENLVRDFLIVKD